MVSRRIYVSILLMTTLLSMTLLVDSNGPLSTTTTVSADCEDDLIELREELNATNRELEQVREERDDYAQRLEDSTTIMIIVMFLLIGSYVVFYLNARRAKIAYLEFQKKMGVNPDGTKAPPRRRRRG